MNIRPGTKVLIRGKESAGSFTVVDLRVNQALLKDSSGIDGVWPLGVLFIDPNQPNYGQLREDILDSQAFNFQALRLSPSINLADPTALPQAGGANSLTLNISASSVNNAYTGSTVLITAGLGANEAFVVRTYDGPSRVAALTRVSGNGTAFTLDATSRYRIYSLEQFYDALNKVSGVFAIQRAYSRLDSILSNFASAGDRDNATRIARFQTLLNEWVSACGFDVAERDELRGLLATNVPSRGYTVPV
jgi:hypothetical protein